MLSPWNLLEWPTAYRLFTRLIRGEALPNYVRDYVRPQRGHRILDIGCGPADIFAHLPDVIYQGFDLNPRYIQAARRRFGSRGHFSCEDVTRANVAEPESFDIVMANGVLHHLDDGAARKLLALAHHAVRPTGRVVLLDPCYLPNLCLLPRLFLRWDRGRHIGPPQRYVGLAREFFAHVCCHLRQDLLRIPYSHCVVIGTKAIPAE